MFLDELRSWKNATKLAFFINNHFKDHEEGEIGPETAKLLKFSNWSLQAKLTQDTENQNRVEIHQA